MSEATPPVPSYLRGFESLYAEDPRAAACAWFAQARYGLFLHYGLYSLLGRHEWVQLRERIPVAAYEKLAGAFTAENFDAEAIASLAVEAGMRYVNLTTRHHDSFCLFRTAETDFQSLRTPCGRDLVGELAAACARRGLGLCLYYSHGRDWRHPHAANNESWGGNARPPYDPPEPSYAYGGEHDLNKYLAFVQRQVDELLTQYGPVASVWLDGVGVPLSRAPAPFRCEELYARIRSLQPQVLVAYKQGVTGTEDYFAPEHALPPDGAAGKQRGRIERGRLLEICTTMCPGSWGYSREKAGEHLSAGEVWEKLRSARAAGANLLLNTGPLPDGSLDPEDVEVLLQVGARLCREGFPE